ncbi:hypothetical protein [Sphingomonas sp. MMS24-J13]|uniref:hypothetical protein n=1 Tax=Sphingomonas sp. MMS24-J13 TaxID=3238686 RepID=UPI00384F84B8
MSPHNRLIVAVATCLAPVWTAPLAAAAPPNGGTIAVAFNTPADATGAATTSFREAADDALATKGFTILDDPGHAAYVAELTLTRVEVGTQSAKVPRGKASANMGGSAVGGGVTLPLSHGETMLVPLQRIRLDMRISKRGEDGVLWTGAAVTVRAAGTKKGADTVVAADLSRALLNSYPVTFGDVVTVP